MQPSQRYDRAIHERLPHMKVARDVPLAPHTTFRIGGPADLFVDATTPDELADAVLAARESETPYFVLGRGANVLVGDRGFRGVVIRNAVEGIEFLSGNRVCAGAGVDVYPDLIEATVEHGLGGLHHFVGIPGTVGGALWQNLHFLSPAPARERTLFIAEVLDSAEILTEEGRRSSVDAAYFEFGYDQSILHHRDDIVLSATFRLHEEAVATLRRVMAENLEWRAARHPDLASRPSAGSIFQKIEEVGAGRLIDQCGLKGHVHGRAAIFEKHANIIVNLGGATATEVRHLMDLARDTVQRETGYVLVPEITLVGEF
ncbi:MAG: UDP-N-acetylmuramate dehydrogenase [Gemmatimonadota bacterium]|nr:UDP-N-acetylmuramate dehydrogenase [Gemmatimonadota bacterium]MDH5758802.1 UDP-N-acetylmuramate dehydrogenase [Gemmatimonadota bacterium]